MIEQKYKLNAEPKRIEVKACISQYDKGGGRKLKFDIVDFDMPSGAVATINGKKPDGKVFSYRGTVTGNTAIFDVTEQMSAVAGLIPARVRISKGGQEIAVAPFYIKVVESAIKKSDVPSESEIPWLEVAVSNVQKSANAALASEKAAAESERNAKESAVSADADADTATKMAKDAKAFRDAAAGYAGATTYSFMTDMDGYICLNYKED